MENSDFNEVLLRSFIVNTVPQEFKKNHYVINCGQNLCDLYFVRGGTLHALASDPRSDEKAIIEIFGRGNFFGYTEFLSGIHKSPLAYQSVAKFSYVHKMPFEQLSDYLVQHPEFRKELDRVSAIQKLQIIRDKVELSLLDATDRLISVLAKLQKHYKSNCICITQEDLAGMVGCTRFTIAKILKSFVKGGTLSYNTHQSVITILRNLS